MKPVIDARNLSKTYGEGPLAELVLFGASVMLSRGECAVLHGPSGSGKTTLLSIMGALLSPSGGEMWIDGKPVDFGLPGELCRLRRTRLGYIFQQSQLLPFLTVEENLSLVARNAGVDPGSVSGRVDDLTRQLDVAAHRRKRPGQLSGGQRQRVAIARALIHRPPVVLADEPTAALDWDHGAVVVDLLINQTRSAGAALLVVTHDLRLLPRFDRIFTMSGGRLMERTGNKDMHAN